MSAVMMHGTLPGAWRRALPWLAVLVLAVVLVYAETAASMVRIWAESETFTHGFVIVPIACWLAWRRRDELAQLRPRPTAWTLLPIVLAGLLWLLGHLASANAATQFALVALIVLTVVTVLGTEVARVLVFPLCFLFFAVPFGEFMMPQLMAWTADFTEAALRATGLPVYREGQHLVIPSGRWWIVEACSGIRYLIASVMVGTLFAYVHYRRWSRRLLFVGVSIVVPIVANWVRAYLIVMTGHLSDNRLAVGVDHLVYGWIFFGIVIVLTFLIGARWSEPPLEAQPIASRQPTIAAPLKAWPAAAAAALLVAPALVQRVLDEGLADNPPVLASSATLGDGWRRIDQPAASWKPAFAAEPSAVIDTTYSAAPGRDVGLYVGYYRRQGYERKMVNSENVLVRSDDPNWLWLSNGTRTAEAGAEPVTVHTAQLGPKPAAGPVPPITVWQVYWVDGRLTGSAVRARLYGALQRFRGRGDDAAVIIVYTELADGAGDALLDEFMRSNLGVLTRQLKVTRDGD